MIKSQKLEPITTGSHNIIKRKIIDLENSFLKISTTVVVKTIKLYIPKTKRKFIKKEPSFSATKNYKLNYLSINIKKISGFSLLKIFP